MWPLLTGGRCSEVVSCYKDSNWDSKRVVAVDRWSLAKGLTVVKTTSSLTEGNGIQSLKFFKCKKFEMIRFETDQSDKTQKDIFQDISSKIRSNFVIFELCYHLC